MLIECLGPHCGGQKFDSWDPRYNRICPECKQAMRRIPQGGADEFDAPSFRPAKTRRQADRERLASEMGEVRGYNKGLDVRYRLGDDKTI